LNLGERGDRTDAARKNAKTGFGRLMGVPAPDDAAEVEAKVFERLKAMDLSATVRAAKQMQE